MEVAVVAAAIVAAELLRSLSVGKILGHKDKTLGAAE